MKAIQLIDDVCWGKISIVQWSPNGFLYCICGDEDQTLKAWDPQEFTGKAQPTEQVTLNTMKEQILGFKISPYAPKNLFDEMVMYGKRKFTHVAITKDKTKYVGKLKSPATLTLKPAGEAAFTCCEWFPDGSYAVGSSSGCIYLAKGASVNAVVVAHASSVGEMIFDGKFLITAGFDKLLKKFSIDSKDTKNASPDKKGAHTETGKKADPKAKDDKKEDQPKKTDKKKVDDKSKTDDKTTSNADADYDVSSTASVQTLTETWQSAINIPNSDFILQPRAMAYDKKKSKFVCWYKNESSDEI
jgi:WD40 repeat protein